MCVSQRETIRESRQCNTYIHGICSNINYILIISIASVQMTAVGPIGIVSKTISEIRLSKLFVFIGIDVAPVEIGKIESNEPNLAKKERKYNSRKYRDQITH